MTARSEKATFLGSGGDRLAARLDLPSGEPVAFALFAHCFTCSKDLAAATQISRRLVEQGYGVLRFDFTGLGSSEGEFANTNFSSNVEDLVLAAAWLRDQHDAPSLLVGHSLGGAAVLVAAGRVPEVTAVATIGAPFDPAHLTELFPPETLARLDDSGEADVELAGRAFRVRRQLLEDLSAQHLTDALGEPGRALLVFHAPLDTIVGIDNARRVFDAARHPKSFVSLDGADHLLTRRADATYVATVLAAWAGRYLPAASGGGERPGVPAEGVVVVEETGAGMFAQEIRAGHHTIGADEPIGVGDDTGPTPYDLLLASLGACTSMTLRMYADRQGWPLERVSVTLTHDRSHADDCRDPERKPCIVDNISRSLELHGPLSDEQRARLLEIAEKCPVHRTLHGDVRIRTRVVGLGE